MKLFEILGSNRTVAPEGEWRQTVQAKNDARDQEVNKLAHGHFVITPEGRKHGPFADYDAAASFRRNRKLNTAKIREL